MMRNGGDTEGLWTVIKAGLEYVDFTCQSCNAFETNVVLAFRCCMNTFHGSRTISRNFRGLVKTSR